MRSPPDDATDTTGTGYRPANLLLRSSHGAEPAPCPAPEAAASRRQLLVSLSGNTEARLAAWAERGELADEVAVLTAEETRGAAAAPGAARTTGDDGAELSWATVPSAGDLSEIGVRIDRCLRSWSGGHRVGICFDSVSALLAESDLSSVFRFLHVLMRRVDAADVVAHYHVEPARHSQRVVSTVEVLFEHVRGYDERTGAWTEPPRQHGQADGG